MARKQIEWDSFVKAFPSLTNIEFHAILRMSWSFEESARPLLPFDSYANKRRLAQELVRGEWNDAHLFAAEKMQMYQLEQAIHRLKLKNHGNLETSKTGITVQFNLAASASAHFGDEAIHLYDAVRVFLHIAR